MDQHIGRMNMKFTTGRDDIAYDLSAVQTEGKLKHNYHSANNGFEFNIDGGPLCTSEIVNQMRGHIETRFGDTRPVKAWHRYDANVRNFRTSLKDGPQWCHVKYRATCR